MKENIDLENFCPYDWLKELAKEKLEEELRKAMAEIDS